MGGGVAAGDINNDGFTDLFFSMDRVTDTETDNLYRNDGTHFTKITETSGVKQYSLSLSVTASDINQDGWTDLFISNDFSTPDCLYINQKDGTFKNEIKTATAHTSFYGMGADIADFNNDGLLDIVQMDMDAASNRRSKANMASKDYFESLRGEKKHEDSLLIKSLRIPSEPIDNYIFKNNGDLTFSKNNEHWGITDKGTSIITQNTNFKNCL